MRRPSARGALPFALALLGTQLAAPAEAQEAPPAPPRCASLDGGPCEPGRPALVRCGALVVYVNEVSDVGSEGDLVALDLSAVTADGVGVVARELRARGSVCMLTGVRVGEGPAGEFASVAVDELLDRLSARPAARPGIAGVGAGLRPGAGPDARAAFLAPLPGRRALVSELGGGPWGGSAAFESRTARGSGLRLDLGAVDRRFRLLLVGDETIALGRHGRLDASADLGDPHDRSVFSASGRRALRQAQFATAAFVLGNGPMHAALRHRSERSDGGGRFDGVDLDAALLHGAGAVRPEAEIAATVGTYAPGRAGAPGTEHTGSDPLAASAAGTLVGSAARIGLDAPVRTARLGFVPRGDVRVSAVDSHASGDDTSAASDAVAAALGARVDLRLTGGVTDVSLVADADYTSVRGAGSPALFMIPDDGPELRTGFEVRAGGGDRAGAHASLRAAFSDDRPRLHASLGTSGPAAATDASWFARALALATPDGLTEARAELGARTAPATLTIAGVVAERPGTPVSYGAPSLRAQRSGLPRGSSLWVTWAARFGPAALRTELGYAPREHRAPLGGVARLDVDLARADLGLFGLGGRVLDGDDALVFAGLRLGAHPGVSWFQSSTLGR